MKQRAVFKLLKDRLEESRKFIQVLLGPRQVGKTTMALNLVDGIPCHYVSADLATLQDLAWLEAQWEVGRKLARENGKAVLIVDEAQKIAHWSEMVKKLWDADTRQKTNLLVVLLGSSPWLMQKGLSESLAGRFEIIPVTHWSFVEMEEHFGWSLDEYIYFGGYPGSASLISDEPRWSAYINDALIETTISRDILLLTQVNKPALLRRLFQLSCTYSGQILSYQKMVGQLQDAGNTTTLAHYLDLLAGAGLVTGLDKFANQHQRRRGSSPKLMVFNTALLSAQSGLTFEQAQSDRSFWGRLVESTVGAHLLNAIRGTQIELSYWREGHSEVDFVLTLGPFKTAIEVKSNRETKSGLDLFRKKFHSNRTLLVGDGGLPLEDFLKASVDDLVR